MHNKFFICLMQDEVDPTVSIIKVEKAPLGSYGDSGAVDDPEMVVVEVHMTVNNHTYRYACRMWH